MTSKWGHAKVAGSGPTSVVTLGNLIECLSPLIKTNNNVACTTYMPPTQYITSQVQQLSLIYRSLFQISVVRLCSPGSRYKAGPNIASMFQTRLLFCWDSRKSLSLAPCLFPEFWTYKTWRKKHQVSQTLCGPLNSILDLQIEAVYVPPGIFWHPSSTQKYI